MAAAKTKPAEGTPKRTRAASTAVVGIDLEAPALEDGDLDAVSGRRSQFVGILTQLMVATREGKVEMGEDEKPKWVRIAKSDNQNHARTTVNNITKKHQYPGGKDAAELFEFRVRIPTDSAGKKTSEVYARYLGS